MKKPIFLILTVLFQLAASIELRGQITEITALPGRHEILLNLPDAGPKIIHRHATGFDLLELDLTPFLSATYPQPPAGYSLFSVAQPYYVTESTFDLDPSTIEYAVNIQRTDTLVHGTMIVRTDGTVLLIDTLHTMHAVNAWDAFTSTPAIVNMSEGSMLILTQVYGVASKFYSLLGTLPCLSCDNGDIGLGLVPEVPKPSFDLFPNPTDGMITINYSAFKMHRGLLLQLYDASGRHIRSMRLDDSGNFSFSTSGLAKGSYHAMLADGSRELGITKTFIVE
jgi:hypothetical protein